MANSCSTMHKIHAKEFTLEDFSYEKLGVHDYSVDEDGNREPLFQNLWLERFKQIVGDLNIARQYYLKEEDPIVKKQYWWQMIQLLPSSYNQKRTVMLNYEVLVGMYKWRKNHKLDEWVEFCKWIETLPFAELITMEYVYIPSKKLPEPVSYDGPRGYVRTEEEIERDQRKLMEE